MRRNSGSNRLIKGIVMAGDFALLNLIIQLIANIYWRVDSWPERSLEIFILVNNLALLIAQLRFSTIIHMRLIGAGDLLQRMVLNDNKQSINGGGLQ